MSKVMKMDATVLRPINKSVSKIRKSMFLQITIFLLLIGLPIYFIRRWINGSNNKQDYIYRSAYSKGRKDQQSQHRFRQILGRDQR